jgi:hypothetical protein
MNEEVMLFNATLKNIKIISWWSVLLVDETGVPGENRHNVASPWHNIVRFELLIFFRFMLLNLFFVGVRVAQLIFCEGSCCSISFLWGFMLLNLFFVRVRVAQFIFCEGSCCSFYFLWGFMLLNLFFVGVCVAQFVYCEGSCCPINFLWGFMLLKLFFVGVRVAQCLLILLFCRSLFVFLSFFDNCIVCLSLIYSL